jgi:CDP-diglyceride synthetase
MRLKTYFTKDISFLLIVAVLAVNLFSLKNTNKQINREVKIISFLSVFYIFLLPLGGYRPYRPDIIRYDTFMPITIALLYLVGRSTFLASEIIQRKKLYYSFLTVIFAIFMYADKPQFNDNDCQYERMIELKNSKELITVFDNKCNLLTWSPLNDTAWTSQVSQMCYYWQITDKIKPFIINN